MCDEPEWESGLDPGHTIEWPATDNRVVGILLGPDGAVLLEVHERPTAFGFARWRPKGGAA